MMNDDETRSRQQPVQEDMAWQQIEWRLQLVGYAVLFLFVLAGAAGLFSKGWLSEGQIASSQGQLSINYERFGRLDSNLTITLTLHQLTGDNYEVTLESNKLDALSIQTLQPQPDEAWSHDGKLTLRWQRRPHQQDASIWLTLQPVDFGRYPFRITLNQQSAVRFTQFIYP